MKCSMQLFHCGGNDLDLFTVSSGMNISMFDITVL